MSRTIGVFVAQLEDAYQTGVWEGIVAQAEIRGLAITCFVGPRDPAQGGRPAEGSVAFQIASPPAFGGLIRLSNTIGIFPEAPGLAGLPQVSLGWKLPGLPSVTVDGAPGLAHLVRHLVEVHGRRRFAVVTGPAGHGESEDRESVIRRTLASLGIVLDESLVVRGTFYNASGAAAVRDLLGAGKSFDVLMALNDRMALGAYEALAEAGLRVPEDVAVTGFDNIEQCNHVVPTLTTVDQPLKTMGALAVDMVADLMEGRVPGDRVLSCEPVLRWSCGCPPRAADILPPVPGRRWDPEAFRTLTELLAAGDETAFLKTLSAVLEPPGGPAADGWSLVSEVEAAAFPGETVRHPLAEVGRRLASEARVRTLAARLHGLGDRSMALRNLAARIAGSFGRDSLLATLQEGWETVGIRRGFLVLFDPAPAGTPVPPVSRVAVPPDGTPFPTRDLLPPRWGRPWDTGRWVVEPLVYQEEPLGYLLLEETARDLSVYAALRDQVASTLKGTLLMEALRDHERSLEEEVLRRTRALTLTNEELRTEVGRRRTLERQVQEISDRTMRRIGQDLHDDLCQHLAGVAMMATVVRRGLPEAAADAGPALDRIGALLQDSVLRARHIAQGLYPPGLEERGLADALEELVVGLRDTSAAALVFETEGDCRGSSPDRRLQMFRIVQEAVTNAIRHSGTDVVRIGLVRDADGGLTATVTDFGSGLAARSSRKGLGLSIMRYRADAAGLELKLETLAPGLRVVCRWPPEEESHG
jgi:DNA-binding LacI/PurR family transcriptional regulator/signal transduction histidine kinase